MYAIGLMSGTSLDGIDAALVDIEGKGITTKVKLIAFETYDIPADIKAEIKIACLDKNVSVALICSLNFKIGKLLSDAVKAITIKAGIDSSDLSFVASHGQTIYHLPKDKGSLVKSTLQIGEPSIIAFENNVKVISNFRTMDMAAGGAGAPLVPYSEFILYGGRGENIALQNIGGIGNVTVIPSVSDIGQIRAFDTGPGNMMIDEACIKLLGLNYDGNGDIARSGKLIEKLFSELCSHDYIKLVPPKTTGREEFGEQFVSHILAKYNSYEAKDIIRTFTEFTAYSIVENYTEFILDKVKLDKIIIGGGGAHNKFLLECIQKGMPHIPIFTQDELGYSSDAKEAIAFAVMGNETISGETSNIPSATGANYPVILGNITPSPFKKLII